LPQKRGIPQSDISPLEAKSKTETFVLSSAVYRRFFIRIFVENMALTKTQKEKIVKDLKDKISKQKAMIFIDFTGLKVKDLFNLRKKLKTEDSELKVAKKTLMGIALKEAKLKIDTKKMAGEIALVFGFKDEISSSKVLYQFSRETPNLKILGGFFENKFKEAEDIITLAQLPSREELLARLVGSIQAPITNFFYILQANIKGLIIVLAKAKT
jgi:large subunit ribosomal protein L10